MFQPHLAANKGILFCSTSPPMECLILTQTPGYRLRLRWPSKGYRGTGDPTPGIVLLPTIIVPGINPENSRDMGGNGTFVQLESYLTNAILPGTSGVVGDGYRTKASYPQYPTLETLSYDRNRDSFAEGAFVLRNLVNQMLSSTWASRVNIVTHSKGGLVLRSYLMSTVAPPVHEAIFCQTPH